MAIPLRVDFDAAMVRAAARRSKDGPQARRLLALAAVYEGATHTQAAQIGGVTLQIVRDWALKFNAHGPDGLIDHKAPGQPPRLNAEHRAALAAIVENGPIPAVHGVVRWRIVDLRQWMLEEFRVVASKQTMSRELRAMGYRKLSARPRRHAQAEGAIEDFKKNFPRAWRRPGAKRGVEPDAVEIWFADEARVGQKNTIARRWAKRGTRPSAPKDQRTASAYIFGAICPKDGKGAALVMPRCDTEAMNLHLAEIATQIAPGAHAALIVDQAGWRLSGALKIPPNITIVPPPAKCPELNPQENLWRFMRDNWLSNRVFKSYDDILAHCCAAWNKLVTSLEDHVHRPAPMGPWVLISEEWYKFINQRGGVRSGRWPTETPPAPESQGRWPRDR